MRISAIDIGTNTILMLIAEFDAHGEVHTIRDEHTIPRLGKGVDGGRRILPETFPRIRDVLSKLKSTADLEHTAHLRACGTSALRDAVNRNEFLDYIHRETGLMIEILDGTQEAELTYLGAVSEFLHHPHSYTAVLDIGGGSTEITFGRGSAIESTISLDLGCVRLTERILGALPPSPAALQHAAAEIHRCISNVDDPQHAIQLIGVAGTVTTLAAIDLQTQDYDRHRVSGHTLTREFIETTYQQFSKLTVDELIAIPQVHAGRADILLAGMMILKAMMDRLRVSTITCSDRGLRYGIAIQTYQRIHSEGSRR